MHYNDLCNGNVECSNLILSKSRGRTYSLAKQFIKLYATDNKLDKLYISYHYCNVAVQVDLSGMYYIPLFFCIAFFTFRMLYIGIAQWTSTQLATNFVLFVNYIIIYFNLVIRFHVIQRLLLPLLPPREFITSFILSFPPLAFNSFYKPFAISVLGFWF